MLEFCCVLLVISCFLVNTNCMRSLELGESAMFASDPGKLVQPRRSTYQEVHNNLAMVQAAPSRTPYLSNPQTSRNSIQQSAVGKASVFADLNSLSTCSANAGETGLHIGQTSLPVLRRCERCSGRWCRHWAVPCAGNPPARRAQQGAAKPAS